MADSPITYFGGIDPSGASLNRMVNQANKQAAAAASDVRSVNGRSGIVTLDSTDVGLGDVNNTSDADKPVSTAQQTAINGKGDASGPASAVDGNLAVFDGVTGKLIKDGGAIPVSGATDINGLSDAYADGLVGVNLGLGTLAVDSITSGTNNTGVGVNSLTAVTSGHQNTGLGAGSLEGTTTSNNNTGVGHRAGFSNTTGADNVFIGKEAANLNATDNNSIVIGFNAVGQGSNTAQIGNASITDVTFGNATAILHGDGSMLTGVATSSYATAESAITPTGSPFSYLNTETYPIDVIISGGTVSLIEFTRNETSYYATGLVAGIVGLSPGDTVRVTYTLAPTMTKVPR